MAWFLCIKLATCAVLLWNCIVLYCVVVSVCGRWSATQVEYGLHRCLATLWSVDQLTVQWRCGMLTLVTVCSHCMDIHQLWDACIFTIASKHFCHSSYCKCCQWWSILCLDQYMNLWWHFSAIFFVSSDRIFHTHYFCIVAIITIYVEEWIGPTPFWDFFQR